MEYRANIGLDVHVGTVAAAAFVPETVEIAERAASLPQPVRELRVREPTGFALQCFLDALEYFDEVKTNPSSAEV